MDALANGQSVFFVEQVQDCALRKCFYYIQIHTGLGSNIVYFLWSVNPIYA